MGLKEAFKAAAQSAFKTAGNIKSTIIYVSIAPVTYNTSTGAVTPNETSYTGISAILDDYSNREISSQPNFERAGNRAILPNDKKVFILYDDLTPTPKENDYVTISSKDWTVIGAYIDPAQAMWQLQVRLP